MELPQQGAATAPNLATGPSAKSSGASHLGSLSQPHLENGTELWAPQGSSEQSNKNDGEAGRIDLLGKIEITNYVQRVWVATGEERGEHSSL